MEILREITDELFTICEERATDFHASKEGVWYNHQDLLKSDTWTEEKRDTLKSVKLKVAHSGSSKKSMTLHKWKESKMIEQLSRINEITTDIVPVWELIRKHENQFTMPEVLANIMEDCWNEMVHKSQYFFQWNKIVEEFNLKDCCSCNLSLQRVRSLRMKSDEPLRKQNLPWEVLEQIILMNPQCRESSIYEFSQTLPEEAILDTVDYILFGETQAATNAEALPHPMDMILLLFICSDFMLRQVLAFKLFMCQLAIPFIVLTPDDKIEMLLWPLRSIVVEWQKEHENMADHENMEEALVDCNLHMVAFMRYGETAFSKSKMMNAILSPSRHSVFFHKDAPCGSEKRLISNGIVELSHFLPSAKKQDPFKEPALFFNLRGDACAFQVQHGILMDLASVLVIILDAGEVHKRRVNELLQQMNKKESTILVLTNSTGLPKEDMAQAGKILHELIGKETGKVKIVSTLKQGRPKNEADLNKDIICAIRSKMMENQKHVLGDLGKPSSNYKHIVDEVINSYCCSGKETAFKIVSHMDQIEVYERKQHIFPQQGESLHNVIKLMRKQHRNLSKDETQKSYKEQIYSQMAAIRERQFQASQVNHFMKKVILIFDKETATQEYALRWLQMELDTMSRSYLSKFQKDKIKKWNEFMEARTDNSPKCAVLEQDLYKIEEKISAVTCGLEHLMREMAQMYDVATQVKWDQKDQTQNVSQLPAIVARLLLEGHPTELMDGDHGAIPLAWIKAVFRAVVEQCFVQLLRRLAETKQCLSYQLWAFKVLESPHYSTPCLVYSLLLVLAGVAERSMLNYCLLLKDQTCHLTT